ncbi:MAG: Gfo/Idh/MocA family oxidoreductase [Armatimonadetes bacterium]|nr:Gfo/Idh/MocA family oxidoreductase [Armatimonadota bacterium]
MDTTASTSTIRLGIVGCGRILPAHLRGLRLLHEAGVDFHISALCDVRVEDALMFRRKGEGPPPRAPVGRTPGDPLSAPHLYLDEVQGTDVPVAIFTDYRAMLRRGPVDAVLVLTSLSAHHQVALAALEAGKHVSVEKPVAVSVRAARRVVEAAERAGKVLHVAEVVRYSERSRATRLAVSQGVIGDVQIWASGSVGGVWSPDSIAADTAWRHRKVLAGGGPAIDLGVHALSNVRHACGEVESMIASARTFEPVRFRRDAGGEVLEQVDADVEDTFFASYALSSGGVGQLAASWAGHGEAVGMPQAIYGSKGSIQSGNLQNDDGLNEPLVEWYRRHVDPEERARRFPFGLSDGFALENLDFLGAIAAGAQAEYTGLEGLKDLAAAMAILESAHAGRSVRVADVESGAVRDYQKPIDAHWGL